MTEQLCLLRRLCGTQFGEYRAEDLETCGGSVSQAGGHRACTGGEQRTRTGGAGVRGTWEEEGSEILGPAGGVRDFWLVPLVG